MQVPPKDPDHPRDRPALPQRGRTPQGERTELSDGAHHGLMGPRSVFRALLPIPRVPQLGGHCWLSLYV